MEVEQRGVVGRGRVGAVDLDRRGGDERGAVRRASAAPLRDGQQAPGPQLERVGDAVGGGDRPPLRRVAVVAAGDAVERVADLHLVGAVRLRRARRRVLRSPVGVGLVLLEAHVDARPQREPLAREVGEADLDALDHGLERVQRRPPVELDPRRTTVGPLGVVAGERRVDVHQLEQLARVHGDGGAGRRRVEHEAEAERAALPADVAHRRRALAGDRVGLPAVRLAERERRRVEHALDAGAGLDLQVRLLQLRQRRCHLETSSEAAAASFQLAQDPRLEQLEDVLELRVEVGGRGRAGSAAVGWWRRLGCGSAAGSAAPCSGGAWGTCAVWAPAR